MPEDIEKYELHDYEVKERDLSELRALKKAKDAMKNDPFFLDKKNKKLRSILKWLLKNKEDVSNKHCLWLLLKIQLCLRKLF